MNGKTDVNHGLSLQVILKEKLPSSQIFAGTYDTVTRRPLSSLKMGAKQQM